MLTFPSLKTRATKIVSDASSANDTFMGELINETHKLVCGLADWPFVEDTFTSTSTASQQTIKLPVDYRKLITYKISSGGVDYTPIEIADPMTFDLINNQGTSVTSDFPQYFHIRNGNILNFPAISTAGLTITIEYVKLPRDMSAADYTTGTITTLANGGTAVTGSGTTWTAAMVGRYIKITSDGYWYKIATRSGNTAITIDRPYEGTAIAAGSEAYTIGEIPLIPEEFQDLLWYRPVGIYFMMKGDEVRSKHYYSGEDRNPGLFESHLRQMKMQYSQKTGQQAWNPSRTFSNPNYDSRSIVLS